ncbi:hypothetical protein AU210_014637 [Fusarium oxysporum f. sp. radicis-cucumerinum]|uniref:DDE-1 domain-containing protein n=1 Tax=Fusarium oxysporum f. sp. radicis-cucumerinum TaxID=327505 RepID=A0A2H3GFR5_FUSOX|nr:hypothetical protein AU210_014637 [Fusarium oxysporum f. sp. radicis-cucumerinum]
MSDRANVEEWFQKFHTFIEDEENDINLDNIWNIDETGFQIGYLKNGIFLWTFGEIDHPVLTDAHETISVTVVESISAKGRVIPPFIIMPGTQIPSRWVDNRLDENATIVTTPKGYIDQAGDPFHVHRPRIHGVEMDGPCIHFHPFHGAGRYIIHPSTTGFRGMDRWKWKQGYGLVGGSLA